MNDPAKDGRYCTVAVALPLFEAYTYLIPEDLDPLIRPGHRVLVPFGRRRVTGYVLDRLPACDLDLVKPIAEILDEEPAFDEVRKALFSFTADYYLQPMGEVIKTGLPAGINQESRIVWSLTEEGIDARNAPGVSPNDRRVLLCMEPGKSFETRALAKKCAAATYGFLARLRDRGFVYKEDLLEEAATRARHTTIYSVPEEIHPLQALEELSRAPKQREVFQFVLEACRADTQSIQMAIPHASQTLSTLVRRGFLESCQEEKYRDVHCRFDGVECEEIQLNGYQQQAYDAVAEAIDRGTFSPFLLHGVTGSGKTEVYIRLAKRALEKGQRALILVPEIALTPQLVSRFVRRFGSRVAVSHSGLSNPERYDQWRRMLRDEADLCIGTRSAVFSPLKNLGLIVVDEEHDPSYKQDEGVPYNGRDLAMVLGKQTGSAVVLGSATPSLESYHWATQGRYRLIELPERATAGALPAVSVIDLGVELEKLQRKKKKKEEELEEPTPSARSLPTARYAMTPELVDSLSKTLETEDQAILFLNRRGFSSHAFCLECRRPAMCPNCAVSLTPHKGGAELHCHYCDFKMPGNVVCSHCGGRHIFLAGLGTEQVEADLVERFPEARIARLDRDTIARKGSLEKILSDFSSRRYDILVGTQIVTKGHDFPRVTLVGVLCADVGMNMPDFRSAERTFQLLSQVAGRAGRGDRPGRVIVQTFDPGHYAVTTACRHDYKGFMKQETERRKGPLYPPFARLALVRARSKNDSAARSLLIMLANSLRQHLREQKVEEVRILGPAASALSKIKNQFRYQLLLKSPTPGGLLSTAALARNLLSEWNHKDVEWRVDVDPQNVL